jgi:hypothetical protein
VAGLNLHGDKRNQMPPGTRLGPDMDGLMHEVTTVTYDQATNRTTVRTRKLEIGDGTLRFVGGDRK